MWCLRKTDLQNIRLRPGQRAAVYLFDFRRRYKRFGLRNPDARDASTGLSSCVEV